MLKIRQAQFDAFEPKTDEEIINFIVAHLREASADLVEKLPDLPEMVKNGVARARSHKLESLQDLTAFVSIMFEVAPNFDEHAALREVLDDERVPVNERLDNLFANELNKAWEEAARYDGAVWAEAWFPELKHTEK